MIVISASPIELVTRVNPCHSVRHQSPSADGRLRRTQYDKIIHLGQFSHLTVWQLSYRSLILQLKLCSQALQLEESSLPLKFHRAGKYLCNDLNSSDNP